MKICVAIPVTTPREALEMAARAREAGAGLVEFRWDYCEEFRQGGVDLAPFLEFPLPKVFTYRKASEGGRDPDVKERDRREVLLDFVRTGVDWVDVETSTGPEFLREVTALAKERGTGLVYSWHDFEGTPRPGVLRAKLREAEAAWRSVEGAVDAGSNGKNREPRFLAKLVTTARRFEDNVTVLEFCKEASERGVPVAAFCMGELGALSRVLCLACGSRLTYASIGEATAPGQASIGALRAALRLLDLK
ncbi:MAG: hypothetical protein Kow0069_20850 [Promethearchaeota archaeon]